MRSSLSQVSLGRRVSGGSWMIRLHLSQSAASVKSWQREGMRGVEREGL